MGQLTINDLIKGIPETEKGKVVYIIDRNTGIAHPVLAFDVLDDIILLSIQPKI